MALVCGISSSGTNMEQEEQNSPAAPVTFRRSEVLNEIERFLHGSSYKEFIESSSSFNNKLVKDRMSRLPFIDSQTGVAQSDCLLWMQKWDRQPGKEEGQLYSYPARRWRKRKRQYLSDDSYLRSRFSGIRDQVDIHHQNSADYSSPTTSTSHHHHFSSSHHRNSSSSNMLDGSIFTNPQLNALLSNDASLDSRDSPARISFSNKLLGASSSSNHDHILNHDSSSNSNAYDGANNKSTSHSWLHNEHSKDTSSSIHDNDDAASEHTEIDETSELDEDYATPPSRRQTTNRSTNKRGHSVSVNDHSATPKRKRERRRPDKSDINKPFKCEWCGQGYKTRPGLTYHRNHCHANDNVKNNNHNNNSNLANMNENNHDDHNGQNSNSTNSNSLFTAVTSNSKHQITSNHSATTPFNGSNSNPSQGITSTNANASNNNQLTTNAQNSNNNSTQAHYNSMSLNSQSDETDEEAQARAGGNSPDPFCGFCLGDTSENKKTKQAEELISCYNCGRSGHPTCLKFTTNMILSVKKYKWQCIECKSCGLCGKSDNDDQLLFCDDCDRGYHMYCLKPPLSEPPEGSWSCDLCLEEYHKKKEDTSVTPLINNDVKVEVKEQVLKE